MDSSKCPFGGDTGPKTKPADSTANAEAADDSSDKSDEDASASEPESDIELDMEGMYKCQSNNQQQQIQFIKSRVPICVWTCNLTISIGVIEADNDPAQPMGDSSKSPTDEEMDQAGDLRSQAAAAYSEQKFNEAIDFYTKAIELNPGNALYHAKRGQAFLKLKKPNACIRDCDKALS